jgi:hypothetical protein
VSESTSNVIPIELKNSDNGTNLGQHETGSKNDPVKQTQQEHIQQTSKYANANTKTFPKYKPKYNSNSNYDMDSIDDNKKYPDLSNKDPDKINSEDSVMKPKSSNNLDTNPKTTNN